MSCQSSSTYWDNLNDCLFLKIKELNHFLGNEELLRFIDKTFKCDDLFRYPLHDISNVYVLLSEHKPRIIMGYVWVNKSKKNNVLFIDWIDTLVKGHDLAAFMVSKITDRYIRDYELFTRKESPIKEIIPRSFIPSSAAYWASHESIQNYVGYDDILEAKHKNKSMDRYDIGTALRNEIDTFLKSLGIEEEANWSEIVEPLAELLYHDTGRAWYIQRGVDIRDRITASALKES